MNADEWIEAAHAANGAVLVPVKAFDKAKGRLSPALGGDDRSHLARQMATHVVRSQDQAPVAIACDDDGVAAWAADEGARVIWCPGTDLNGAVRAGYRELGNDGIASIAIAHSDLPGAKPFSGLLGWPGVTIVPDRHRTGTNVMVVPAGLNFDFTYGQHSYPGHVAEAMRHRCGLRIVHDADLGWDIDHPDDLDERARRLLGGQPAKETP